MRRIAINMLNEEKTRKDSLKGKRQLAGWDQTYLERVVFKLESDCPEKGIDTELLF